MTLKSMANKNHPSLKKNLFYIIVVSIGALLFAGTIKKVGFPELLIIIGRLSLMKFSILICLTAFSVFVSVWRWRLLLRTVNCRVSWLTSIRSWLADFAFSYFTPGVAFGGEPLRLRILKDEAKKISWAKGAATVFLDKGLDSTVSLLLIIASVFFLFWHYSLPFYTRIIFLSLTLILIGIAFFLYFQTFRRRGYFNFLIRILGLQKSKLWQKISGHLSEMEGVIHGFFYQRGSFFWSILSLTLVRYILLIFRAYLIIFFLGAQSHLVTAVVALGITYLISFMPLPGALGGLEFSQSFVFAMLSLGSQTGLAYALISRCFDIILAGIGFGIVFHLSLRGLLNNNKNNSNHNLSNQTK